MADIARTPAAQQEAARLAIKAREDGIRAQAIKEGRAKERAELLAQLGAKAIEDIGLLPAIKAEMREAFEREEAKHGRFRFYQGGALGMLIGAVLAIAATAVILGESFRQAVEYGREMTMTGALTQSIAPPERCIPGERLPDGRVCPERIGN